MEGLPKKKGISEEIEDLHRTDQADREPLVGNEYDEDLGKKMAEGDIARLKRAKEIYTEYKEGKLTLSEESLFTLGLIFHHGNTPEDTRIALEISSLAGEQGKWLSAVSEDRYLLLTGKKQKWGTQFTTDSAGNYIQHPMLSDEESGVTDEMRKEKGIRIRAEQLEGHLRYVKGEE